MGWFEKVRYPSQAKRRENDYLFLLRENPWFQSLPRVSPYCIDFSFNHEIKVGASLFFAEKASYTLLRE
jgi:hypothetical protein